MWFKKKTIKTENLTLQKGQGYFYFKEKHDSIIIWLVKALDKSDKNIN